MKNGDIELSVLDKVVLEIGSGGGWYIAQCIKRGSSLAIGLEISDNIINNAEEAFKHHKIDNYKFYEIPNVNSEYLSVVEEKVDIIFEITVFQHIAKSITKDYLKNANKILKSDGYLVCQFYIDDENPINDFTNMVVRHSTKELYELFEECNLYVEKYNNLNGTPWRIYLLKYK